MEVDKLLGLSLLIFLSSILVKGTRSLSFGSNLALGSLISQVPTTHGCDDAYFVNARMLLVNLDRMEGIQAISIDLVLLEFRWIKMA